MKVLNPTLYKALEEVFGDVKISNPGSPGAFSYPDAITKLVRKTKGSRKYAHVEDWGEVYAVCCPGCGDTRYRLYFSYLCGCRYKKNKSKPWVYFTKWIFSCKNENCRHKLKPYINKLTFDWVDLSTLKGAEVSGPSDAAYDHYMSVKVTVPPGMLRLIPENMPGKCMEYLEERNFDPRVLDTKYACRLVTPGTKYKYPTQDKVRVYKEENLFIPVIEGREIVSWQTRPFRKTGKKEPKYFNMPGSKSALYNLDRALQYKHILGIEGVTDVWRAGDASLALLGTNVTSSQKFKMKTIWGRDGKIVVLVEKGSEKYVLKLWKGLTDEGLFGEGVCLAGLGELGDPADLREDQNKALLEEGCKYTVKSGNRLDIIPAEKLLKDYYEKSDENTEDDSDKEGT